MLKRGTIFMEICFIIGFLYPKPVNDPLTTPKTITEYEPSTVMGCTVKKSPQNSKDIPHIPWLMDGS